MRKSITIIPLFALVPFLTLGDLLPKAQPQDQLIATHEMSLDDRYQDKFVNEVFKNNILLNLAYLDSKVASPKNINWDEVKKPFNFGFELEPNKTFAFHEDVLDKYQGQISKTTNAHFNFQDGFKTDGYLFGDGVCHLASLIYWAAKDAGLQAEAPTNHDFMTIPDIPKEYGVSIYNMPGSKSSNAQQNLYITNNKNKPITFKFEYQRNIVKVSISQLN